MTDRELLRHIERSAGQRAGYKQLVREFGLGGGRERRLLVEHLARLTASGQLTKVDREQWSIAKAAATRDNLIAGKLDLHRDGFGFVRVTAKPGSAPTADSDIFIPPPEINGAMQGDQVLVEVAQKRPGAIDDGRRQGRIVRVLTRRNPTIVGVFRYATNPRQMGHQVIPYDEKMTQPILIPFDTPLPEASVTSAHRVLGDAITQQYEGLEGLVVDVEVTDWPTPTRVARGRVIEVLGPEDAFGVDVEMVIRKHQLPRIFPDDVLAEAKNVAHLDAAEIARRRDFRSEPIVTIDGETARDFDDAVLVREHPDYWELEVHIADVAQYVRPGTALDLEARLRGNSVYFPDRAIPMLPHELSSDICSLRPDVDRLVLSCLMRIDQQGDVIDYEVTEGVIRSARRMTYTQVAAILDPEKPEHAETRETFADFVPEFEGMQRLAQLLNRKREQRGSIDFDLPEPIIEFDDFGAMKAITRSTRNWAHRLIEEFMLAANESVASWLASLVEKAPSIYRIHEMPEPRRILDFEDTAATFGYSLGVGSLPVKRFAMKHEEREGKRNAERFADRGSRHRQSSHGSRQNGAHEIPQEIPVTPQMYQKLAAKIAGKPEERILSYLMLRSLKQARYSEKNEGHFALAAPYYTHFTSPIRRYPDLIVHRIAKSLLREGVDGHGVLEPGEPHAKAAKAFAPPPIAAKRAPETTPELKKRNRSKQAEHEELPAIHANGTPLTGTGEELTGPIPESELAAIAQESSDNERRADAAERELVEWKKIKFMRDRVGEEFNAMILTVTKYGLFVELDSLFVEGLVPLNSLGELDGDYYSYRENTREIIGEHFRRKFSMGQRVKVLLERVNAVEKRLQFSIVPAEEELPSRPAKKKSDGTPKSAKTFKPSKKAKHKSMQQASKSRVPIPKNKRPKRKKH